MIAPAPFAMSVRALLFASVAAVAMTACASNRTSMPSPDYSGMPAAESHQNLAELGARYKQHPKDKAAIIHYAAALRAVGQSSQAVAVLEAGMAYHPTDPEVRVAYAKALTAAGRLEQSLQVIDNTIRPDIPDWNALLVKGATLDQMGRNQEARMLYQQALTIAPGEASIAANLGLSYAMSNDLAQAEQHLRQAVQMPGANSRHWQNLALVVGLQGRFEECRALYAAELPPEQVENNMNYVRALLTQQNRWDAIAQG
ncbi:MAG TPA: tetratricopeptide repeat protein [Devosia sp.]|nr:tetratricopeptide repeat protein [Devosia sp.]